MSTELYIVCHDCKKGLWAGCDGFSGFQWPHKNEKLMREIGEFLYPHIGHKIGYETEHQMDDAGYEIEGRF